MQQVRRKERGFTIIELVVVILLLGILAAVALPRFINVTDRAYGSAVEGVYGGFATGIAMYRAHHVAEGQQVNVTIDGIQLTFDRVTGYPAIASAGVCELIWNSVLQSGRPSLVDNGLVVAAAGGPLGAADLADAGAGANTGDFEVIFDGGDTSITPEGPASCYYVYTAQYGADTDDVAGNGEVSVIHYSPGSENAPSTLELIRI